jgi:hypothetical protein
MADFNPGPYAPQLSYKAVCTKHGEVDLIERGRGYDIGRCPKCKEEVPNVRFPHEIKFIPTLPSTAKLKVE